MTTAITNVRLFDGEKVLDGRRTVVINGSVIQGIDIAVPSDAHVVDGSDSTLLPGLIDAHTHTGVDALKLALAFGITTELEMGGLWTRADRDAVAANDEVADLRTALAPLTAPGGHPSELLEHLPKEVRESQVWPSADTPEAARALVETQVREGADYIKVMVEEGALLGSPGLPLMSSATLKAGIDTAHEHGKLAIAHATTMHDTAVALEAGVDGMAHIFMDGLADEETVRRFKRRNAFVVPCACLNASLMGRKPATLLADARVTARLPSIWKQALDGSSNSYPQGDMDAVLRSIKTLHDAGVDVLVGTDASVPLPGFGGLAHGASVHHELHLMVEAGLTPHEALAAATSRTAHRFSLHDRGRIAPGLRADLLLVTGDPVSNIADSMNIRAVWRRGVPAKIDVAST